MEKDDEVKGIGNSYDFGARMLDPRVGRWFRPDFDEKEFPWQSPYVSVSDSPIWRLDPDGNWDIEVHAHKNRGKHGYAIMIVKDNDGNIVYRTVVKAIGTGGRTRNVSNSDTPQGKYKILEWRKTGNKRYNSVSFGPNDLLAMEYLGGEGGSRQGMHVHGGRQEGKYKGRKDLASTHGCLRINDNDIARLKQITDKLESDDPTEKKGYLTLVDDLTEPAVYDDNRNIDIAKMTFKEFIKYYGSRLDENMNKVHEAMQNVNETIDCMKSEQERIRKDEEEKKKSENNSSNESTNSNSTTEKVKQKDS